MVTTQSADKALKSFYLDAVTDALNLKINPFFAKIKKSTADVWGKDVRKLVRYGVSGGVGAGTETGALPAAHGTNYTQFVSPLKNLFGSIEISDKALRASANNEGAFVNLLEDEMQSLLKASSFHFGRMLYGDGNGVLGTLDEDPVIEGGLMFLDSKNFTEGMVVDFYDPSGALIQSGKGRRVVKVDHDNAIVYFDGAEPSSEIFTMGSTAYLQNSYGNEITGLAAIFGDGEELYGVKRADNLWMKPYSKGNVGAVDETDIQLAIDTIEERSGSKVDFIVCSPGVRRALVNYYKNKGVQMSPVTLEGGHLALSFNGIPVVSDRFCPKGTMYLLNTEDFCLHQLCDWQWLEGEDGSILKQIPGKPVYSATLVKYAELMCYRPQGQGKLYGITEG